MAARAVVGWLGGVPATLFPPLMCASVQGGRRYLRRLPLFRER